VKPKAVVTCSHDISMLCISNMYVNMEFDWFRVLLKCDWLEWLLWFWFYNTQLKTALSQSQGSEHFFFDTYCTPTQNAPSKLGRNTHTDCDFVVQFKICHVHDYKHSQTDLQRKQNWTYPNVLWLIGNWCQFGFSVLLFVMCAKLWTKVILYIADRAEVYLNSYWIQ